MKYREYVCMPAALHPESRKLAYLRHLVTAYRAEDADSKALQHPVISYEFVNLDMVP